MCVNAQPAALMPIKTNATMYVSSYRPQGDIDTLALKIYASRANINWRKAYAMARLKLLNNKTK